MSTPNYLGFLQATPKQSPFQRALESGLQTYGDVQNLMAKTYATRAFPKEIEQEQKIKEQKITQGEQEIKQGEQKIAKGELEAKYYPEQLEEEAESRRLLLQALPKDISLRQHGTAIENLINESKLRAANLSENQLKENIANNELAKIYETHLNYPDAKNDQYNISKKKLSAFGISLPEKMDDSTIAKAKYAYDQKQRLDPFNQSLARLRLINEGKVNVAEMKGANKQQSIFDKETEKATSNWIQKDLSNSADVANDLIRRATNIDESATKNAYAFGPIIGPIAKQFVPAVNKADADAMNAVLDMLAKTPGASRGTKALLNALQASKVQVKDPLDSIHSKTNDLIFGGHLVQEELNFANQMIANGVLDKAQIQESWNSFLQSQNFKDEKTGMYIPDKLTTWGQYFIEHPEKQPLALRQKAMDQEKYGSMSQENNQYGFGNIVNSIQQSGGLYAPYDGFSGNEVNPADLTF